MSIFLDIETRPKPLADLQKIMPEFTAPANWKDPEKIAANIAEQQAKFIEKAALSPLTGTVESYGYYDDKDDHYACGDVDSQPEAILLATIWQRLTDHDAFTEDVYGWNLCGFDLPFIIKRSWANRVKVPSTALEWYRGRSYLNGHFKDLMQFFCIGSDERYMKLDAACDMLGLEKKVDLDGKLPYEIFHTERAKYHEYLKRDVLALAEIKKAVL